MPLRPADRQFRAERGGERLFDQVENAYESFRELEITGGDRDLTEKEEEKLAKERDALTALCEKEAAKCSS